MTGYTVTTLRKLIAAGVIRSVALPGTRQRRIPTDEARRLLVGLETLPT